MRLGEGEIVVQRHLWLMIPLCNLREPRTPKRRRRIAVECGLRDALGVCNIAVREEHAIGKFVVAGAAGRGRCGRHG